MKQKGAAFRSTLLAIERTYGANVLAAVKAAMPERLRPSVENVLSVNWYPVEISAALHVAIRDVIGKGSWRVSHSLGIAAARIDFTGIYRAMIRVVQYDTIWDRMELTWPAYMSPGSIRWANRQHGNATGTIEGVAGFNDGIWNAIAGRAEGLLLLSGAKTASVEVFDMTPTNARFEAIWVG